MLLLTALQVCLWKNMMEIQHFKCKKKKKHSSFLNNFQTSATITVFSAITQEKVFTHKTRRGASSRGHTATLGFVSDGIRARIRDCLFFHDRTVKMFLCCQKNTGKGEGEKMSLSLEIHIHFLEINEWNTWCNPIKVKETDALHSCSR